jgi:hypothetical protein
MGRSTVATPVGKSLRSCANAFQLGILGASIISRKGKCHGEYLRLSRWSTVRVKRKIDK